MKRLLFFVCTLCFFVTAQSQTGKHIFTLGKKDFLLDGKPLQLISGEMHPARIPKEYWRHRIQMASNGMQCYRGICDVELS